MINYRSYLLLYKFMSSPFSAICPFPALFPHCVKVPLLSPLGNHLCLFVVCRIGKVSQLHTFEFYISSTPLLTEG
jgi:hypothetical protein